MVGEIFGVFWPFFWRFHCPKLLILFNQALAEGQLPHPDADDPSEHRYGGAEEEDAGAAAGGGGHPRVPRVEPRGQQGLGQRPRHTQERGQPVRPHAQRQEDQGSHLYKALMSM